MSTATFMAGTPTLHKRGDKQSVWEALVNATATWTNLDPGLFRDLDFDELIVVSEYHGVLPIVAQRVLESDLASEIETAIKDGLRRRFQANLVRGLPLIDEVSRVVIALETNGIAVIPYKGPVLSEDLWGNSALRECADLDFLVEKQNVDRAGEILDGLGYSRVTPIANHLRPALLKNASEEQFQHRDNRLLLELQWSPAPRVFALGFDAESIWKRLETISFFGQPVRAPSAEDLLMLLSIHGWKHNWGRLIWLGDIAQLLRSSRLDWDRVFSACSRDRNVRLLALALQMANRVFKTPVPEQFNSQDAPLDELVDELVVRMREVDPCSYRDWHRCMLSARDCQADRFRQIATFMFTPGLGEYSACDLPTFASPLYRLVRLARLLHLSSRKRGE